MNFARKIISSDRLENIIEIPDNLKNRKVEIIILPVEPFQINIPPEARPKKARGLLEKYKNTELLSVEHSAWVEAVEQVHF